MSYVFGGMMIIGILSAVLLGRVSELSGAILSEGAAATEMCLELLGTVAVWSGIMEIADGSGLCNKLAEFMKPLVSFLFPGLHLESPKAAAAISLNITANILGLGSAATPMALEAMRELDRINALPDTASNNMVVLTVLNTASFQLLPTTVAAIRASSGSISPMDILPAVWLSSAVSVVIAVAAAKLWSRV